MSSIAHEEDVATEVCNSIGPPLNFTLKLMLMGIRGISTPQTCIFDRGQCRGLLSYDSRKGALSFDPSWPVVKSTNVRLFSAEREDESKTRSDTITNYFQRAAEPAAMFLSESHVSTSIGETRPQHSDDHFIGGEGGVEGGAASSSPRSVNVRFLASSQIADLVREVTLKQATGLLMTYVAPADRHHHFIRIVYTDFLVRMEMRRCTESLLNSAVPLAHRVATSVAAGKSEAVQSFSKDRLVPLVNGLVTQTDDLLTPLGIDRLVLYVMDPAMGASSSSTVNASSTRSGTLPSPMVIWCTVCDVSKRRHTLKLTQQPSEAVRASRNHSASPAPRNADSSNASSPRGREGKYHSAAGAGSSHSKTTPAGIPADAPTRPPSPLPDRMQLDVFIDTFTSITHFGIFLARRIGSDVADDTAPIASHDGGGRRAGKVPPALRKQLETLSVVHVPDDDAALKAALMPGDDEQPAPGSRGDETSPSRGMHHAFGGSPAPRRKGGFAANVSAANTTAATGAVGGGAFQDSSPIVRPAETPFSHLCTSLTDYEALRAQALPSASRRRQIVDAFLGEGQRTAVSHHSGTIRVLRERYGGRVLPRASSSTRQGSSTRSLNSAAPRLGRATSVAIVEPGVVGATVRHGLRRSSTFRRASSARKLFDAATVADAVAQEEKRWGGVVADYRSLLFESAARALAPVMRSLATSSVTTTTTGEGMAMGKTAVAVNTTATATAQPPIAAASWNSSLVQLPPSVSRRLPLTTVVSRCIAEGTPDPTTTKSASRPRLADSTAASATLSTRQVFDLLEKNEEALLGQSTVPLLLPLATQEDVAAGVSDWFEEAYGALPARSSGLLAPWLACDLEGRCLGLTSEVKDTMLWMSTRGGRRAQQHEGSEGGDQQQQQQGSMWLPLRDGEDQQAAHSSVLEPPLDVTLISTISNSHQRAERRAEEALRPHPQEMAKFHDRSHRSDEAQRRHRFRASLAHSVSMTERLLRAVPKSRVRRGVAQGECLLSVVCRHASEFGLLDDEFEKLFSRSYPNQDTGEGGCAGPGLNDSPYRHLLGRGTTAAVAPPRHDENPGAGGADEDDGLRGEDDLGEAAFVWAVGVAPSARKSSSMMDRGFSWVDSEAAAHAAAVKVRYEQLMSTVNQSAEALTDMLYRAAQRANEQRPRGEQLSVAVSPDYAFLQRELHAMLKGFRLKERVVKTADALVGWQKTHLGDGDRTLASLFPARDDGAALLDVGREGSMTVLSPTHRHAAAGGGDGGGSLEGSQRAVRRAAPGSRPSQRTLGDATEPSGHAFGGLEELLSIAAGKPSPASGSKGGVTPTSEMAMSGSSAPPAGAGAGAAGAAVTAALLASLHPHYVNGVSEFTMENDAVVVKRAMAELVNFQVRAFHILQQSLDESPMFSRFAADRVLVDQLLDQQGYTLFDAIAAANRRHNAAAETGQYGRALPFVSDQLGVSVAALKLRSSVAAGQL